MMRIPVLLVLIFPAPALSEGAVQTFDCATLAVCDEAGSCAPQGEASSERTVFRIEPVSVGPKGEGDYRISYGDVSAEMTNVTGLGPLLWSEARGDRQILLITGETSLLWHRFDASPARSSVVFLTCEVTQ